MHLLEFFMYRMVCT